MDIKQILIQNNIVPLFKKIKTETFTKPKITKSLDVLRNVDSFITQFKNEMSYTFFQKCKKYIKTFQRNLTWCKEQDTQKAFQSSNDPTLNPLQRMILSSENQIQTIFTFYLCQLYMLIIEIGYHYILSNNDSIRLLYGNIISEFSQSFSNIVVIDLSKLYPYSLKSYRSFVKDSLFHEPFQVFCLGTKLALSSSIHTSFRDVLYARMGIDTSLEGVNPFKLQLYARYLYQYMTAPYMKERKSIQFNPRSAITMKEVFMIDKDVYVKHSHIQEYIKYINQQRMYSSNVSYTNFMS